MTPEQIKYLTQFIHPDKRYAWLPGKLDDACLAAMFGIDAATYASIRAEFKTNAHRAARALLDESAFCAQLDRLPFTDGARVVALGDSLTDDWQSWLEILRLTFEQRGRDAHFINAGISAETTTDIFNRFIDVVRLQPDWILCAAGANDTWFWTDAPIKLSVSLDETARNLLAMRQYAASHTTARWVWFTPPSMIPEQVTAHWYQGAFQMMTRNEDLTAIAEIIRAQPDPVVDLQEVFGLPANPGLLMDDGLHPNLAGHMAIVRALASQLTDAAKT